MYNYTSQWNRSHCFYSQDARGDGQHMLVKHGDMIGFYCPGDSVIPYDLDETAPTQAPFYAQPTETVAVGQSITMDSWMQAGCRQYSLTAIIVPGEYKLEIRVY